MVKVKVVAIGDEILIGQIVNSNASFIGDRMFLAGMPVERMVTIGDNEKDFISEMDDSMENFDVTIITGGLGPTHDDLTKPLLVKYFNDEFVENKRVMEHIREIFTKRDIHMPEINKEQAMVPKSADVIWNTHGTAPGMWIEKNGKIVVSLPGVPYEMKSMMDGDVIPKLKEKFKDRLKNIFRYKTFLTTGVSESGLYEMVGDLSKEIEGAKLAYLPSGTGVRMRIGALGESEEKVAEILGNAERLIREKAGKYIYGEGEEGIERIVGKLLLDKRMTLSVAESCTGGKISAEIVSVPGSSEYYMGGVCSYSNEAKMEILGVKEETLKEYGAVSEETAKEMAEGVRKRFGADVSISTTGIAGPDGGSNEKPVGLVWIGYSDKEKTFAKKFLFGNTRERNINRSVMAALDILRKELLI